MSGRAPWLAGLVPLLWPLVAVVALAAAALSTDLRGLLGGALAHVTATAVLATLPGQAIACLLCGAALFALRPGVTFGASVLARLLRDAGANLLLFMPGLGEVIGTRVLVLSGGRTTLAITVTALDNFAEAVAQIPFALLALLVLPRLPGASRDIAVSWIESLARPAAFVLPTLLAIALILSVSGRKAAWRRLSRQVRAGANFARRELGRQWHGFPAAVVLHGCAWAMGGVQLWMMARALSLPLDLFPAIVIESTAYAGRAIFFFVPAGVAVQEAALVFAGLAYGLSPGQSLTIAVVLRLRDLVFGLPLLLWPLFEIRRDRRLAFRGGR